MKRKKTPPRTFPWMLGAFVVIALSVIGYVAGHQGEEEAFYHVSPTHVALKQRVMVQALIMSYPASRWHVPPVMDETDVATLSKVADLYAQKVDTCFATFQCSPATTLGQIFRGKVVPGFYFELSGWVNLPQKLPDVPGVGLVLAGAATVSPVAFAYDDKHRSIKTFGREMTVPGFCTNSSTLDSIRFCGVVVLRHQS